MRFGEFRMIQQIKVGPWKKRGLAEQQACIQQGVGCNFIQWHHHCAQLAAQWKLLTRAGAHDPITNGRQFADAPSAGRGGQRVSSAGEAGEVIPRHACKVHRHPVGGGEGSGRRSWNLRWHVPLDIPPPFDPDASGEALKIKLLTGGQALF
jgi:hypothetical protein